MCLNENSIRSCLFFAGNKDYTVYDLYMSVYSAQNAERGKSHSSIV